MASDFERFLGELSATMGIPSAPAPVTRTPRPVATPTPAPSQSPFANASPQQQQMIHQASAGLPPDLVAQIASLAASTAQQAPQRQQPQMPQMQVPQAATAMASTQPMGVTPQPRMAEQPTEKESPLAAKEGEGYYFVEYTDQAGDQHRFFVPERYADNLPENARVNQEMGLVENPQIIENARGSGALLEQQPDEVTVAFRDTRASEQIYEDSAGAVDRSGLGTSPTVIGEKTPEQQADLAMQNQQSKEQREQAVTVGQLSEYADYLESEGDTEGAAFYREYVTGLQEAGITEVPPDKTAVTDQDGKYILIDKQEAENMWEAQRLAAEEEEKRQKTKDTIRSEGSAEPVGTELPDITRAYVRDTLGNDALANEMERDGIYSVADGDALVRQSDGTLITMNAAEAEAGGHKIEIYGGESKELQSDVWGKAGWQKWNIAGYGVEDVLEAVAPFMGWLDDNFLGRVQEGTGEMAYRRATGGFFSDGTFNYGIDSVVARGVQLLLPKHLEENTHIPFVDFNIWANNNEDAVIDAYENGYTDPETGQTWTGGEAVWEKYSSTQPITQRIANDLPMDPLNLFLPVGGVIRGSGQAILRKGATSAATAPKQISLGRRLLGTGVDTAGRVMRAPDEAMDWIIGRGATGVSRTIRGADDAISRAGRGRTGVGMSEDDLIRQAERRALVQGEVIPLGSAIRKLARESDDSRLMREDGDIDQALRDVQVRESRSLDDPEPGGVGQRTESAPTGSVDNVTPGPASRDVYEETGGSVGSSQLELEQIGRSDVDTEYLDFVHRGDMKNPFEGMKVGEAPDLQDMSDWEWLTPQEREVMAPSETNRIIDEIFQKNRDTREYLQFADTYEPLGLRFIAQERRATQRSIEGKPKRGNRFDSSHMRASALNEARHIVHDLIPAYKSAFGQTAEVPAYRFKNQLKKRSAKESDVHYFSRHNDQTLIEYATFSPDPDVAAAARGQIEYRINNKNDANLARLNTLDRIDKYRERFLRQQDGTDPVQAMQPQLGMEGTRDAAIPPVNGDAVASTPPASASSSGERIPISALRSTWRMSDDELAAAGVPRMQTRTDAFDPATVEDLTAMDSAGRPRFDEAMLDPIVYTTGSDGWNYIVAGHSRVESARRIGMDDIPARYVPSHDHDRLLRIATETNTNTRRFTPLDSARLAGEASEGGATRSDVARRLGLQNQARGSLGTNTAGDLVDLSRLDRDRFPRLAELVDQGDIDISTAAMISRAIDSDLLGNGEITTILRKLTQPGGWSQDDVRRLIAGRQALGSRQSAAQTGLFGDAAPMSQAESLVDDIQRGLRDLDPNASQLEYLEGRLQDVADVRRQSMAQLRQDFPEAVGTGRGANRYIRDNVEEGRLPQYDRDMKAINDLGEILDIPEHRRLIDSATGSYGYSTVPGGPQLSRAVSRVVGDVPEGGLLSRQVDNPAYRDAVEGNAFVDADTSEHQYARGRDLSENEKRAFNYRFEEGDTVGERWDRYTREIEEAGAADPTMTTARAETEAAARVVEDHAIDNVRNVNRGKWKDYKLAEARIARENPDLDASAVKIRAYGETVVGDSRKALKAWDAAVAVQREMVLYNTLTGYRYILTQGIGNSITALITGHAAILREAFTPRNLAASYRQLNPNATADNNLFMRSIDRWVTEPVDGNAITDAMDAIADQPSVVRQSSYEQRIAEYGFGGQRHEIGRVIRDQVTDTGERVRGDAPDRPLRMTRVADKLRLGRLRLPLDKVFANRQIRDLANTLDLVQREALYVHQMDAHALLARDGYQEHMRRNLPRGADEVRFNELWENDVPQAFGSDRIRNVFEEIDPRYAERMARDWQNSLGKVHKASVDEVNRIFFSGNLRNADEILNRVVFFHYWMSRATPLYTEALLRNPGLLNNYYKMMNYMYEEAESGQYGAAVKGFVKIFSSPAGFNIFIRPDAYLQTVLALDSGSDFIPENETGLGAFLRKFPFFTNPLIASGINLMGLSGSTFPPDPLMLGNWANATTTLFNTVNAHFGDGGEPVSNRYNDFWSWIRSGTSSVSPFGEHTPYTSSTAYARRDINNLIQEEAINRGMDPNSAEVTGAMDNPDSELYQVAYKRYANGRGVEQMLRILPTSVFYPKARVAHGDRIRYEINNTPPGSADNEYWRQQRTMAQTTDRRARPLINQGDEYYSLGTDRQRNAYRTYNSISFGPMESAVIIDGKYITEIHLEGLSEDERRGMADKWAEQTGVNTDIGELRELRREYRDTHSEWNEYMTWTYDVREHSGGPSGWWDQTARGNPNADRWYSKNITPEMSDAERDQRLTSVDAYMAVQGIQKSMYDPDPISTNNMKEQPYMATSPDSGGGGSRTGYGTGSSTTIEEDIAKYEQDMAAFNAKYGNLNHMTPPMRQATMNKARNNGDSVPRMSSKAQRYLEWAAAQPPGSDTSVPAYERWKGVEDTSEEEQGLVGSNQQADSGGINELLSILQL